MGRYLREDELEGGGEEFGRERRMEKEENETTTRTTSTARHLRLVAT
jgi:hypothetical protein